MRKRTAALAAGVAGMLGLATPAGAAIPVHAIGWNAEDGPMPAMEEHPGGPGHLPAGSRNVDLVGKVRLTNVDGGIADVSAFDGYAYLNAFSPECTSNGGGGTGVHVVDISRPASPKKVGFIAAHPNSFVGEGIHIVRADTPSFRGDILIHNNETCNATQFAPSGASLWDVTDPLSPKPLSLNFGDPSPVVELADLPHHPQRAALRPARRAWVARTESSRRCRTTRTWPTWTSSTSPIREPPSCSPSAAWRTGPARRARTRTGTRSSITTCSTSGSAVTTTCSPPTGTPARCC